MLHGLDHRDTNAPHRFPAAAVVDGADEPADHVGDPAPIRDVSCLRAKRAIPAAGGAGDAAFHIGPIVAEGVFHLWR
ncbi:hypothetical protein ATO4_14369 [Aurantimonas sp. 22II-16-19i]|nr:hypothetical protein ATO4_14369 [Aurantimonas sp. 22II-16-19i]